MMRLQATSAAQLTATKTQMAQTKPSFKGSDDDFRDQWTKNKQEFEELSNDYENPTFVKKLGKAGVILATGILGYGTAKFGMRKSSELVVGIAKSKPVQAAKNKAVGFVTNTVIPDAKDALNAAKTSKLVGKISQKINAAGVFVSNKISQKFDKAAAFVKQTRVAKFVGGKISSLSAKVSKFAQKEKVAKVIAFTEGLASKIKAKVSVSKLSAKAEAALQRIKAKIPTVAQAKNAAIETLAVGSGMAAAMTGSGMANNQDY